MAARDPGLSMGTHPEKGEHTAVRSWVSLSQCGKAYLRMNIPELAGVVLFQLAYPCALMSSDRYGEDALTLYTLRLTITDETDEIQLSRVHRENGFAISSHDRAESSLTIRLIDHTSPFVLKKNDNGLESTFIAQQIISQLPCRLICLRNAGAITQSPQSRYYVRWTETMLNNSPTTFFADGSEIIRINFPGVYRVEARFEAKKRFLATGLMLTLLIQGIPVATCTGTSQASLSLHFCADELPCSVVFGFPAELSPFKSEPRQYLSIERISDLTPW